MASAGASCCRAMLTLRLEFAVTTSRLIGANAAGARLAQPRGYGNLCRNETWCRRWWNISRKGLSTGTRSFTPSLSPMLSKEQQHYKEARESRETKDARESKDGKESKDAKGAKESKDSKKQTKDKSSAIIPPEVVVEYYRGLPRITLPLPSRPDKCMFTLKPITQTIGDFLDMIKQEDPAVVDAHVTSTGGIKLGTTNRIEVMLMDDFNLIINDKIYPVTPPLPIESKENILQMQDLQALVNQAYETFNAREYNAELEREVMLQLEEVRIELEPLEQRLVEIEESAARRSHMASWCILVLMSMQFGCLARLTWWEYSWDIMEPVTYFVTYAYGIGYYIYYLFTKQEYMLRDVFQREHLIGLYKKAKKVNFDLERFNRLKEEEYELETMLKVIRGPLHLHQVVVEQKRRERLELARTSHSSSSSSSSRSPSSSPSPSPERTIKSSDKKASNPTAVRHN